MFIHFTDQKKLRSREVTSPRSQLALNESMFDLYTNKEN